LGKNKRWKKAPITGKEFSGIRGIRWLLDSRNCDTGLFVAAVSYRETELGGLLTGKEKRFVFASSKCQPQRVENIAHALPVLIQGKEPSAEGS